MTIELTRELLERYLRAMGEDADEILRRYDDATPIGVLCNLMGTSPDGEEKSVLLTFRLGLCAAAEMVSRRAEVYRKSQPPDPFESEDTMVARLLLIDAGIDTPEKLAAWEAAR